MHNCIFICFFVSSLPVNFKGNRVKLRVCCTKSTFKTLEVRLFECGDYFRSSQRSHLRGYTQVAEYFSL